MASTERGSQERRKAVRPTEIPGKLLQADTIMGADASSEVKWEQLIGEFGLEAARHAATRYQQLNIAEHAFNAGDIEDERTAQLRAMEAQLGFVVAMGKPAGLTVPAEIPARAAAVAAEGNYSVNEYPHALARAYKGTLDPREDESFSDYYLPPVDGDSAEGRYEKVAERIRLRYEASQQEVLGGLTGEARERAVAIYEAYDFSTLEGHMMDAIKRNDAHALVIAMDRAHELFTLAAFILKCPARGDEAEHFWADELYFVAAPGKNAIYIDNPHAHNQFDVDVEDEESMQPAHALLSRLEQGVSDERRRSWVTIDPQDTDLAISFYLTQDRTPEVAIKATHMRYNDALRNAGIIKSESSLTS